MPPNVYWFAVIILIFSGRETAEEEKSLMLALKIRIIAKEKLVLDKAGLFFFSY